jgi:uncharacterized RmlC-like cupin family protein
LSIGIAFCLPQVIIHCSLIYGLNVKSIQCTHHSSTLPTLPYSPISTQLTKPTEQDTIVYAASGHGSVISENGKKRQDLSPGDFALIPAWTEHQEVNDGDEDVTWIISRSGGSPVVVNLEGWGKGEAKS